MGTKTPYFFVENVSWYQIKKKTILPYDSDSWGCIQKFFFVSRQVSEVKRLEDDLQISKRQLENFDRLESFWYQYYHEKVFELVLKYRVISKLVLSISGAYFFLWKKKNRYVYISVPRGFVFTKKHNFIKIASYTIL